MARKSVFSAFLGLAISVGLGACTSQISGFDQMLIFAEEVYFGGPIDKHLAVKRTLIRWSRPLQVSIEGPNAERYRDQVTGHLADFTRLSKLQAGLVDEPGEANVAIVLSDDDAYHINGEVTPCFARVQGTSTEIQRVDISIGVIESAEVEHCLAHELYHAFGLRFHSTAAESVLSPAHGNTHPTPADDLALSMLYDPRLRPGVAPHEAAATLRELTSKVTGDFGNHWSAVSSTTSRIQILQNADKGYVSRYLQARRPSKHITIDFAYWQGPAMFHPAAAVFLQTAEPGYFIDSLPSIQKNLAQVGWLQAKSLEFGEQSKRMGRHGLMDTIEFGFDNVECLGFRQRLASRPNRFGSTDLLIGYLCANPGASMDMKVVDWLLQNVKIRGVS